MDRSSCHLIDIHAQPASRGPNRSAAITVQEFGFQLPLGSCSPQPCKGGLGRCLRGIDLRGARHVNMGQQAAQLLGELDAQHRRSRSGGQPQQRPSCCPVHPCRAVRAYPQAVAAADAPRWEGSSAALGQSSFATTGTVESRAPMLGARRLRPTWHAPVLGAVRCRQHRQRLTVTVTARECQSTDILNQRPREARTLHTTP